MAGFNLNIFKVFSLKRQPVSLGLKEIRVGITPKVMSNNPLLRQFTIDKLSYFLKGAQVAGGLSTLLKKDFTIRIDKEGSCLALTFRAGRDFFRLRQEEKQSFIKAFSSTLTEILKNNQKNLIVRYYDGDIVEFLHPILSNIKGICSKDFHKTLEPGNVLFNGDYNNEFKKILLDIKDNLKVFKLHILSQPYKIKDWGINQTEVIYVHPGLKSTNQPILDI